ncbi:hypothetical protein BD779DRAFT_498744 [Infundibulicybe gibba]|nr:hypothetical protein BD779DRAFT_498744 [Infundibulicybe gibba]
MFRAAGTASTQNNYSLRLGFCLLSALCISNLCPCSTRQKPWQCLRTESNSVQTHTLSPIPRYTVMRSRLALTLKLNFPRFQLPMHARSRFQNPACTYCVYSAASPLQGRHRPAMVGRVSSNCCNIAPPSPPTRC